MKTKICSKCREEKPLSEFRKDKTKKDGYYSSCKKCCKGFYQKNIVKYQTISCEYYQNNKDYVKKRNKKYNKKYPEKIILRNIKARCENLNNDNYKYYGKRGIKCLITEYEVKILWERDKACMMKKPSIDRINNDGHYTFQNCRFIEQAENSVKDKRKPILQFDLEGNFIKEWPSLTKASEKLNISIINICSCCRGKQKSAGGFKWKYVD